MKTPWDKEALGKLPSIAIGQCCSLKVQQNGVRVWLCRTYGGVTVEQYKTSTGRWEVVEGACDEKEGESLYARII